MLTVKYKFKGEPSVSNGFIQIHITLTIIMAKIDICLDEKNTDVMKTSLSNFCCALGQ